jgi:hypothetical protein
MFLIDGLDFSTFFKTAIFSLLKKNHAELLSFN